MTEARDGGPAFPCVVPVNFRFAEAGISTRDLFAAAALIGLGTWTPPAMAQWQLNLDSDDARRARARWAYAQADAMLSEREKLHD